MASMRDIKRRKSSIQSTQQITKAMKLVSTVKLQKGKKQGRTDESIFRTICTRPLLPCLQDQVGSMHPYLKSRYIAQRKRSL